jgi:hypothetical protein
MIRALALYSGSPASALAVKLAERAGGLDIRLVYFRSPFFRGEDRIGLSAQRLFPCHPFRSATLKRDYLRLSLGGHGLPFPCGSCRRVLLSKAARLARRLRAEVVITGEVVGRGGLGPDGLSALDAAVGLTGRVLRPLSARLLSPTEAELAGWVDRAVFLDVEDGASTGEERLDRLARELGATTPRGEQRCLLSDPEFVARLAVYLAEGKATANLIQLLEFRHFYRVAPDAVVVMALTREEQATLQTIFLPTDVRLYLPIPGSPLTLVRADWTQCSPEERRRITADAARITLRVAGVAPGHPWSVRFRCEWEEETHRMSVFPPGQGWEARWSDLIPPQVGVEFQGSCQPTA